jgi:hypothetical protein
MPTQQLAFASLAGPKPNLDHNAELKLLMELIEDDADEEDCGLGIESAQD